MSLKKFTGLHIYMLLSGLLQYNFRNAKDAAIDEVHVFFIQLLHKKLVKHKYSQHTCRITTDPRI